jgi:hypothetical protein
MCGLIISEHVVWISGCHIPYALDGLTVHMSFELHSIYSLAWSCNTRKRKLFSRSARYRFTRIEGTK